jgi:hypothetical protein
MDAFISRKKGCPNFPLIFWAGSGGGTLLPHLEGLICCSRQREIAAIDAIDSSLAYEGASPSHLQHHHHHPQHQHHLHLEIWHHPPHSLW